MGMVVVVASVGLGHDGDGTSVAWGMMVMVVLIAWGMMVMVVSVAWV